MTVDPLSEQPFGAAADDLLRLTVELAGSLDARTVMGRILERSLAVAAADRATLSSIDADEWLIEATVGAGGEITWVGHGYESDFLMRQPLVVELIATQRPVLGGRMDTDEALPEFRHALGRVAHTALVPILEEGRLVGMLVLSRYEDKPFTAADLPSLSAFGALAGLALRNAKLFEEERAAGRRLQAAAEAAAEVAALPDLPAVLARIIDHARDSAGGNSAAVMRIEGKSAVLEATSGSAPVGSRWPLPEAIVAAIAAGQPIQVTPEGAVEAGRSATADAYGHILIAPMRFSGALLGILVLGRVRGRERFATEDVAWLQQFATLAALVLHNGRLVHRLLEAETMKRDFMNIAVHELRGPLTVVEGYAEMLMRGDTGRIDREAADRIAIIRRQGAHALSIAEDLLIVARLESDELGVDRAVLALPDLVTAAAERARPRARLREGDIDVTVETDGAALGDRALVGRILDNLLTNAIAYAAEAPRVTVTVGGRDGRAAIAVMDNGPGIDEEERELVFARFWRSSRQATIHGTGLGLYLSRECARRMGGDLLLEESGPGGSRFLLTLPLAG